MTACRKRFLAPAVTLLLVGVRSLTATEPTTIDGWVAAAQQEAGLTSWWGKKIVQAEIAIVFGGQSLIDATFVFEAHGPKAKMIMSDGTMVVYDGKTAWTTGGPDPQARFHVLTWPWFVMAPFKMKGEGITLGELGRQTLHDRDYITIRQTFGRVMGDAPDDWYRFFIDPRSKRIDWMQYIVTYGKDLKEANASPSVIRYEDFRNFAGVKLAVAYTFHLWDNEAGQPKPEPKGVGTVKNVRFLEPAEADFTVPKGAREIPLP